MANTTGNQAWRPDETSPESAYEGRLPPEDVQTNDPVGSRTMPTGGVPSSPDQKTGSEADPASEEQRREAGGAPAERGAD